jgi:hypothetical protein
MLREVSYTKNAWAIIKEDGKIDFYGREGGIKRQTFAIKDVYQDVHLLSFYRSEYLSVGIKVRVIMALKELGL